MSAPGTAGQGVFETLRIADGVPLALRRHLARLAAGAAALGLDPPGDAEVRAAVDDVLAAYDQAEGRLRISVAAAPWDGGSDDGPALASLVVAVGPLPELLPTAAVRISTWRRDERQPLTGVKSTSYADLAAALADARRHGASEAILATRHGALGEGTGANVFVVRDGRLLTPSLGSGVLPGIVRQLVLEVTDAEEEDMPLEALLDADEAFLTSAIRHVQPIESVGGRMLPAAPGPRTRAAAGALAALFADDVDP